MLITTTDEPTEEQKAAQLACVQRLADEAFALLGACDENRAIRAELRRWVKRCGLVEGGAR